MRNGNWSHKDRGLEKITIGLFPLADNLKTTRRLDHRTLDMFSWLIDAKLCIVIETRLPFIAIIALTALLLCRCLELISETIPMLQEWRDALDGDIYCFHTGYSFALSAALREMSLVRFTRSSYSSIFSTHSEQTPRPSS